ncbi:4'-phosphopantetheinyl transferase [Rhizocola hellebori]|uniref:4'-phosphopantetheinyl transferase n=1 Tax=Rhizocola hellebori TaxID=1392758 RepID=A0A8J3VJL5_9ACTN|nr:4'-phosphopantetheinyl transferase superfamily protein [Rhizocola hellebori]GIH08171.1 4'-phosphopantetheinyl transferase [Rhizocola hellebori]
MLLENELHVWQGVAPRETTYADWAMLSKEEHARWLRMSPVTAARFAASHAAARKILGGYLHAPPITLRMGRATCPSCGRAASGRPVVHTAGAPLWFSLSHSGQDWLLAIGRHLLGVDIEVARPVDIEALESLALSEPERKVLADHDKADRHSLFYRSWTRKEAVFKATGLRCLSTLDVRPEQDEVVVESLSRSGPKQWLVRSLAVGSGRYAAVAGPAHSDTTVVLKQWPTVAKAAGKPREDL